MALFASTYRQTSNVLIMLLEEILIVLTWLQGYGEMSMVSVV